MHDTTLDVDNFTFGSLDYSTVGSIQQIERLVLLTDCTFYVHGKLKLDN